MKIYNCDPLSLWLMSGAARCLRHAPGAGVCAARPRPPLAPRRGERPRWNNLNFQNLSENRTSILYTVLLSSLLNGIRIPELCPKNRPENWTESILFNFLHPSRVGGRRPRGDAAPLQRHRRRRDGETLQVRYGKRRSWREVQTPWAA